MAFFGTENDERWPALIDSHRSTLNGVLPHEALETIKISLSLCFRFCRQYVEI